MKDALCNSYIDQIPIVFAPHLGGLRDNGKHQPSRAISIITGCVCFNLAT